MANTIQIKRGLSDYESSLVLAPGEIAVILDLGTLKFGDQDGNVRDIVTDTVIEAGEHIYISDGQVINVVDIGSLENLNTEEKATLVDAINEALSTALTIDNNLVVLRTNMESQLAQITKRLDQLDGGPAETTITTLVNSLITIRETDGIQIGNGSSIIQTSMTDNEVKFQNSGRELLSIRENELTGELQTFCESLNANIVQAGVHERKSFVINGERRTGFFYTDGGEE